jgi:hypothetical protein
VLPSSALFTTDPLPLSHTAFVVLKKRKKIKPLSFKVSISLGACTIKHYEFVIYGIFDKFFSKLTSSGLNKHTTGLNVIKLIVSVIYEFS